MIVDLKVDVEIVHFFETPRKFFFWVRESSVFFRKRSSERCYHETPAKDKRGVRERFAKVKISFAKNGRFADKGI